MHNQIIVINVCGLGSDTKYFMDLKVESEQLYSTTDNPEILKRFESQVENEILIENEGEEGNESQNDDNTDENKDRNKNEDLNKDLDINKEEDKIEKKDDEVRDLIYSVDKSTIIN